MNKPMKKSLKSFFAILIAVVLVIGMIPVSPLNVFAATQAVFTVEMPSTIDGSIYVTLTNATLLTETKTEIAVNGKATFNDFVDTDKTYNIEITGMIGYGDYTGYFEPGTLLDNTIISFITSDFTPLETIMVSGQITDENASPYTGGGTVSYSGYDTGSVALERNGTFTATIYKSKPYTFSFIPNDEKYVSPVSLGSVNSAADVTNRNAQLAIKTFSITTNADANGTISPYESSIPYGSNRSITATSNSGYQINTFTINGTPVLEAEGEVEYSYDFNNITGNYTVNVTFTVKTWDVTFNVFSNGTIVDGSSGNITPGGKITAAQGNSPGFTATPSTNYHISSVVIDGVTQTNGRFDNNQRTYSYTFSNISSDHTVSVTFSINTYNVTISPFENGSVTVGGAPAGPTQTVGHGGSLTLTLTPADGYDVIGVSLDGIPSDSYDFIGEGPAYSYVLSSVTTAHNVAITFDKIKVMTDDELKYYNLNATGFQLASGSSRIYNFFNDGASVTFTPTSPTYGRIRINGTGNNALINGTGGQSSKQFTSSVTITKIEVHKTDNPDKGWKEVEIAPIQIIIDKTPPTVNSISKQPNTAWTKNSVTVSGTASDDGGSNLYQVRYSKNAADFTADTFNNSTAAVAALVNGAYSFSINNDVSSSGTYYVWAYDSAGNKSAAYQSILVSIDIIKPEITGFTFQKIEPPVVSQVINFFTFGIFYNDAIEVIVSSQDIGSSRSGVKEITLYSNDTAVETKTVVGNSATFTLTLADFSNNVISASASDNAGNISDIKKPTEVTTNAFNDIVSLKTDKPTISIVPVSAALYSNEEENWYDGNVGFNVNVETQSAGIHSVKIKVNGQDITTDKNGKAIDANFFESQTLQEMFMVNTDYNPLDGENIIEVIAVNNYGNEETASIKIFIDTTNPKVIEFNIDKENGDALSKILNFLTFGNFFNEKVKITVIADDRYGATSGISTITLYADGVPIGGSPQSVTAVGDGTYKAEFILPESVIPEAKLLDAVLTAAVIDNVGNITGRDDANPNGVPITPTSVNSDLISDRFVIETVSSVIDISTPAPVFSDSDGRKWYPDDILFAVTAKDKDSGIRSVGIKINGEEILTDAEGKPVNSNFYNTRTHEEVFKINTSQGTRASDGSYLLEVTVVDNAGNKYSKSGIVYKDIDNPSIASYRFIPATSDGISETFEFIDYMEYGFYFKEEATIVIQASDQGPSSGLSSVGYRFVSYQNGMIAGEVRGTQIIVDGMAALTIPQGFKGQIFAEAFDNVDNISSKVTSKAFVVTPMTSILEDDNPGISITNNSSTRYNDADGNPLYVSDVSFTVVVSDNHSGIKEIGYSQSSENGSIARKSILLGNTGFSVGDILEDGWEILEMDVNLVTKVTKTFSVSSNDNDIILAFDMTDRSGNKREKQSEKISIDKTAPIINVVFRNDEAKNGFYYSANRIADITVIERNFDANLIIAAIENKYGKVPTFSFTSKSKTEHVAQIDFDEGDYTFEISGSDLGNHAATANYSGGNEKLFYVDKTKPAIEDNFDTFSKNETKNSFNANKTAIIKITEHNFTDDLVNLKIKMKDAGESHTTEGLLDVTYEVLSGIEWKSFGNIHTIEFTLSKDGIYQIEMTPLDLAENSADRRSTVVFEIDQTAPIVTAKNGIAVKESDTEFLDIYPYSRKDDPAPTVEFFDLNIDHIKYDLTVWIPNYTSSEASTVINPVNVYLNEDKDKSGIITGSLFTLPDFIKDGIYALELTAVDVAGNESLLNTNTYAKMIEQDVLAYILESNLAEKTGLYSFQYENGDAISKRPDNFSDIKIFVLAKKDTGIDIVLRDKNADEVNTNAQATIDDSIYGIGTYNFILESDFFKENFQDDTDVELYLTVKNEDKRIDLGKLRIDNIAPAYNLPEEFKSWRWYYGDEARTITVSDISEPVDKNQCKVYDNGQEIGFEYSSEDNALVFTLEKGWHNVGIILEDMAGNASNIQEKANIHIGYFWLWIIVILSVLFTAASFAVIYAIRKKRKLENI